MGVICDLLWVDECRVKSEKWGNGERGMLPLWKYCQLPMLPVANAKAVKRVANFIGNWNWAQPSHFRRPHVKSGARFPEKADLRRSSLLPCPDLRLDGASRPSALKQSRFAVREAFHSSQPMTVGLGSSIGNLLFQGIQLRQHFEIRKFGEAPCL